jgi:hypothetical protein
MIFLEILAQVCGDVANSAFDAAGAFFRHYALPASCLTVVGHTFSIAANYLPHHSASPEQLLCQSVVLLFVAVDGLVNTSF